MSSRSPKCSKRMTVGRAPTARQRREHEGENPFGLQSVVRSVCCIAWERRRRTRQVDQEQRPLPLVESSADSCPVGDHLSNGSIEVSVRELKSQRRAVRTQLETRLGIVLATDDPFLLGFRHSQDTSSHVIDELRTARQDLLGTGGSQMLSSGL